MATPTTMLTLVSDPTRIGLTVIPTSTPLTRLNFFDGKFLRADDLRLDQDYGRLLVSLAVRGGGSGIVHGFELEGGSTGGDELILRAGLALTASGQVIFLPGDVTLSLTALLAKSGQGSFDPSVGPPGSSAFGPCAADSGTPPDVALTPQPAYVITIAGDEALCGEEERFGELCSDACLTDVDRPRRVEGVRIRARQLDLSGLPASATVTFTAAHYRSRLASAYFAAEQASPASLISGAGLASPAWCARAEAVDGVEVPVAVVAVSGGTRQFIDLWTARRELMTEPARRYWAMRMAMRPWDLFLAQVLQFQCQLRDGALAGGGVLDPGSGPCAPERGTLRGLHDVILDLSQRLSPAALKSLELDDTAVSRFRELTDQASRLLVTPVVGASGSLLVDRGLVSTPSAGYLPVDAAGNVPDQVQRQFGPGVDLRFCAARADVLPHLLEQAQHMERISLTAGLDDPDAKPQVDVILPDGSIQPGVVAAGPVYTGTVTLFPRASTGPEPVPPEPVPPEPVPPAPVPPHPEPPTPAVAPAVDRPRADGDLGSALELTAVARQGTGPGWRWAVAAYGEAGRDVSVATVVGRLVAPLISRPTPSEPEGGGDQPAADTGSTPVTITPSDVLGARRTAPRVVLAANRERTLAAIRRAQLSGASVSGTAPAAFLPDRPLAADEPRPVAGWLDIDVAADLSTAAVGTVTQVRGRLSSYSRASTNPLLVDVTLDGALSVTDRSQVNAVDGTVQTVVRTAFDGVADILVASTRVEDAPPRTVRLAIEWRFGQDALGRPVLLGLADTGGSEVAVFEATRPAPDQIRAAAGLVPTRGGLQRAGDGGPDRTGEDDFPGFRVGPDWTGHSDLIARAIPSTRVIASTELRRDDQALDPGRSTRDLADAAIEAIGAELSLPGRDPRFSSRARALLYPDTTPGPSTIVARRDWVMFHRRRTVDCTDSVAPAPAAVRHYRAYHAVVNSRDDLPQFDRLVRQYVANASELLGADVRSSTRRVVHEHGAVPSLRARVSMDDLGFELVGVIDYAEGGDLLLTPVGAVRSAWSVADRGTELLWQGGGDVGPGDGDDVLRRRMTAYRAAVSGLIDVSNTPVPVVMADVPDEFVGAGTDGAVFTIGLRADEPPPVDEKCHVGMKISAAGWKRLLGQLNASPGGLAGGTEGGLRALASQLDTNADFLEIDYENDKLTDAMRAALLTWWFPTGGEAPPREVVVLVDGQVAGTTHAAPEEQRAQVVLDALHAPAGVKISSLTFGRVEHCNAITAYLTA